MTAKQRTQTASTPSASFAIGLSLKFRRGFSTFDAMSYDAHTHALGDKICCRIYPRNLPRAAAPPHAFNWAIREVSPYVMSEPPPFGTEIIVVRNSLLRKLNGHPPRSLAWFLHMSDRLLRTRFQDLRWTCFTPSPDKTSPKYRRYSAGGIQSQI
jgi:hypothetical protein